jgi:hypothetical protein
VATAVATKEETLVGVDLSLTGEEAKALCAYLDLNSDVTCAFRCANQSLYAVLSTLGDATA